jgi:hypothetical protein
MEIYNCTHYNYCEHLALVASQIPLTELYCADVSLRGLTGEHFLTHWRRLTPSASKD